ncbi:beta-propeller fold lactonase family protein [bacterium]|nr:beta-propeller fold lactonase family protein [bacterium]
MNRHQIASVFVALAALFLLTSDLRAQNHSKVIEISPVGTSAIPFYIGTYTTGESKGIYRSELDLDQGTFAPPQLVAEIDNPSFLAISGDRTKLYAVGEISDFDDKNSGAVTAFSIEQDGMLKLLNQQASGGRGPCHVSLGPGGTIAMVANYGAGSFASLPVDSDGKLGPITSLLQDEGTGPVEGRQKGPHAHGIYPTPNGQLVLGADLGTDKVMIFRLVNQQVPAELAPSDPAFIQVAPGSGPRHLAINMVGDRVYVLNELNSTLDVFAFDQASGKSEHLERHSTLPAGFEGNNTTAEVFLHPNGKWLYCSNRGHDSIATFRVDPETGKLSPLGQMSSLGKTPRCFQIDPSGQFLVAANQGTSNIAVFRIDQETGTLKPLPSQIKVPNPCCIVFPGR